LIQSYVLPFGQKNSGTEAQAAYIAAAKDLKNVINYVDDWVGFANTIEELIESFRAFLKVCIKHGITLNTSKTKVGFSYAQFFGFRLDATGSHLAAKHLMPIKAMVPPTDVPKLRRVLGLLVVSRRYIPSYATITNDRFVKEASAMDLGGGSAKSIRYNKG
jgi:hypothetical protein